MSKIFFSVLFLFPFISEAQSLKDAKRYFENYEYALAASSYESFSESNVLSRVDFESLGYCYYIIGDYKKCLPISDSIIKMTKVDPFFYYINGEVNMGEGNYGKAKSSFEKYQSLDSEYDVSIKIASCEQIPTWSKEIYIANDLDKLNTTKANITSINFKDGEFYFSEIGKDSLGTQMEGGNIDHSELVLMRPFYKTKDESRLVSFDTTFNNASISSITFENDLKTVYVTVSMPLATAQIDMVPHIYIGEFNDETTSVNNLVKWKYSGYEDSSSCAHTTINQTGDLMVFTKMNKNSDHSDLYYSVKNNGEWDKPMPVNALNTNFDELYPVFQGDTMISFASDGRPGYGGLDVFLASVNDNVFSEAKHLKMPINSFKDDFNFIYYSLDSAKYSSNRRGGIGDDDMYFTKFTNTVIEIVEDSSDFYNFLADWETPKVYFEFDEYSILNDIEKLNSLKQFLAKYPKSTLTIEGHTDRRGTVNYNLQLAYNRATEVKNTLVKAGFNSNQINVVSKGQSEPQVDCSNGCTEKQHALNRVALFILDPLY